LLRSCVLAWRPPGLAEPDAGPPEAPLGGDHARLGADAAAPCGDPRPAQAARGLPLTPLS
jgi:hypothetical protein